MERPEWVKDEDAPVCFACKSPFSTFRRRHHCRCCGAVCCSSCTANKVKLPQMSYTGLVRVCDVCLEAASGGSLNVSVVEATRTAVLASAAARQKVRASGTLAEVADAGSSRVFREGTLHKLGGKRRNWLERRVVLTADCLSYYKPQQEGQDQLMKRIPLDRVTKISVSRAAKDGREHCLVLETSLQNGRTFYVAAPTSRLVREWALSLDGLASADSEPGASLISAPVRSRMLRSFYRDDVKGGVVFVEPKNGTTWSVGGVSDGAAASRHVGGNGTTAADATASADEGEVVAPLEEWGYFPNGTLQCLDPNTRDVLMTFTWDGEIMTPKCHVSVKFGIGRWNGVQLSWWKDHGRSASTTAAFGRWVYHEPTRLWEGDNPMRSWQWTEERRLLPCHPNHGDDTVVSPLRVEGDVPVPVVVCIQSIRYARALQ